MPVLNEAKGIEAVIQPLQAMRKAGCELIVVDGGSEDETVNIVQPMADKVIVSGKGRASQMNIGAELAQRDILLFIHGDTLLPGHAYECIDRGLGASGKVWGRFDVSISGESRLLRMVESLMNFRSRYSGIATGDQAIFVTKTAFKEVAGFPEQPLMEDIALSKALKKISGPLCLREKVVTSSRRWEEKGLWRTIFLMWSLRLAYFVGVSPERLVKTYYGW